MAFHTTRPAWLGALPNTTMLVSVVVDVACIVVVDINVGIVWDIDVVGNVVFSIVVETVVVDIVIVDVGVDISVKIVVLFILLDDMLLCVQLTKSIKGVFFGKFWLKTDWFSSSFLRFNLFYYWNLTFIFNVRFKMELSKVLKNSHEELKILIFGFFTVFFLRRTVLNFVILCYTRSFWKETFYPISTSRLLYIPEHGQCYLTLKRGGWSVCVWSFWRGLQW